MRFDAPAAPAQCCFPEPKPPAQADAGRRSDAPARSKEPRRASTRRLVPRSVASRSRSHLRELTPAAVPTAPRDPRNPDALLRAGWSRARSAPASRTRPSRTLRCGPYSRRSGVAVLTREPRPTRPSFVGGLVGLGAGRGGRQGEEKGEERSEGGFFRTRPVRMHAAFDVVDCACVGVARTQHGEASHASRTAPRSQHSSSGRNPLHLPPPTPPALAAAIVLAAAAA